MFERCVHPGRVYCLVLTRDGEAVVLFGGADKDSQQRDIERARRVATDWR